MHERGQLNKTKETKTTKLRNKEDDRFHKRGQARRWLRAIRSRKPPVQSNQVHPRAEQAALKKMGKKGTVSGPGTVPSTGNRQDFI